MKTVLLAYEREQDLSAIETLLQSRGHRVVKTRTGVEALDTARRESPHVVVSDVMLPKLDGFALCRRLKEDALLQHVPVILLSFRVEGAKYEAFAAEVGAERFFQRGSTLEELAVAIEEQTVGSGTMRMPALVPELLERREQDRRRLVDLERLLKNLETANQQLTVAERVAREQVEREAAERQELAAADATRIRELEEQVHALEASRDELAQAETEARGAAEESKAGLARVGVLESRLAELQASRTRAEAAAVDAERAFALQPVPTWLSDMATHEIRAASDSAGSLLGIAPEQLRGRSIRDVLAGYEPGEDPGRTVDVSLVRADGSTTILELHRQSISYAGRACWLTSAREVTSERSTRAAHQEAALRALALDESPLATCLAGADGRLQYANPAFLKLLGLEEGQVAACFLHQFEVGGDGDSTHRSLAAGGSAPVIREGQWRRMDGSTFEVELAAGGVDGFDGVRVVVVRDVTSRNRALHRANRDHRRASGLLELNQRAHALSEAEILSQGLALLGDLVGAPTGHAFLTLAEAGQVELAASRGETAGAADLSVLTRWHGTVPADTALAECLGSQSPVMRESPEGTGVLRQGGIAESFRRQLCVPLQDGGRLAGVLLLADKAQPFDEEDVRHAAPVAEALWRLLRRRRSDAEVVSAMDHMERVMLGVIESVAVLAESQDACKTGRARRVAELASGIGTALGLPGHTVRGLQVMGQLIDVGMLQIPREILWRPGALGHAEYELVKTHPERGSESLRQVEFPWPVAEVVLQHHERLDGSGYPRGLKGEEILLEARIVAVADAAEAMLSPRPQRAALPVAACIDELQSQAGRRYDARVVKACVKLLRERESRVEGKKSVGQRIA